MKTIFLILFLVIGILESKSQTIFSNLTGSTFSGTLSGSGANFTGIPVSSLTTNGSINGQVVTCSNGLPVWQSISSSGGTLTNTVPGLGLVSTITVNTNKLSINSAQVVTNNELQTIYFGTAGDGTSISRTGINANDGSAAIQAATLSAGTLLNFGGGANNDIVDLNTTFDLVTNDLIANPTTGDVVVGPTDNWLGFSSGYGAVALTNGATLFSVTILGGTIATQALPTRYVTTNLTAATSAIIQFTPAFNDTNYGVAFTSEGIAIVTPLVTGKTTTTVTTSMGAYTGKLGLILVHQ